jgi:hypothetical protein
VNAERREAAVEAAAWALDQKRHGQDPDRETCSICREEAVLMVDTVAPHLLDEPTTGFRRTRDGRSVIVTVRMDSGDTYRFSVPVGSLNLPQPKRLP